MDMVPEAQLPNCFSFWIYSIMKGFAKLHLLTYYSPFPQWGSVLISKEKVDVRRNFKGARQEEEPGEVGIQAHGVEKQQAWPPPLQVEKQWIVPTVSFLWGKQWRESHGLTGLWGKCRSLSDEWEVLVKGRRDEHLGYGQDKKV